MAGILMARLHVYANSGSHAKTTPYLLDVQRDLLDGLDSRMVIPQRGLQHFAKVKLLTRLKPVPTIMGAVPQRALKSPMTSSSDGPTPNFRSAGLPGSGLLTLGSLPCGDFPAGPLAVGKQGR